MAGYGTFQVEVDLNINGVWTDISAYVMQDQNIVFTRGQPDESTRTNPGTLTLKLNNTDGRFTPKNATGPYYPYLGRNTPVRVTINSGANSRFYGECSSFDSQPADPSAAVVFCTLQAAGILRRLTQSNTTLRSPQFRYWTEAAPNVVAYWPMEDTGRVGDFASGLPNGRPMDITGNPQLAANSDFPGSAPLPAWVNNAAARAPLHGGGTYQVTCNLEIPAAGDPNGNGIIWFVGGSGTDNFYLQMFNSTTFALWDSNVATGVQTLLAATPNSLAGQPIAVRVQLVQSLGNIVWTFEILIPGGSVTNIGGASFPGTLGTLQDIQINPQVVATTLNGTCVGQVAVQSQNSSLSDLNGVSSFNGWSGETAGNRLSRLCGEEGIAFTSAGTLANTVAMGPQSIAALSSLLQECAAADMGVLEEPRTQFGLKYRTRYNLQNQTAGVTLDLALKQLGNTLEPVDDDQFTANDVTVTLTTSSRSHRQVLTTGALSTQAPPNGVGTYATSATLNLQSSSQGRDAAGWLLHLGTINEPRYPSIVVEQARSEVSGLLTALQALNLGDYMQVIHPDRWLAPDPIKIIIQQIQETIGTFTYQVAYTGIPESAYETAIVADTTFGHVDTDGSTLSAGITNVATTMSVATAAGSNFPLWTTAAGDFPFDVRVAGERMTVTNITGASSPQTFTVTRSVNGVVKAQSSGAAVSLFFPPVISI